VVGKSPDMNKNKRKIEKNKQKSRKEKNKNQEKKKREKNQKSKIIRAVQVAACHQPFAGARR
jgi:hypothetical protein